MRELNECTAEVFRRSKNRITERKFRRKRLLTFCIPLCLIVTVCSIAILPAMLPIGSDKAGDNEGEVLVGTAVGDLAVNDGGTYSDTAAGEILGTSKSFSFSLTWGCYGISSYDSESGRLVKTTDSTHPEDYVTSYKLTESQQQEIYRLISELDVKSYPDTYNPHQEGFASSPSLTLILSVKIDGVEKTITASDIAYSYKSEIDKGQRFLDVCKAISDILTETEEWKSLPEYEFFYD